MGMEEQMTWFIIKYVCLAGFFATTFIHLYASNKNDKYLRSMTKWPILLFLLGFYVCANDTVRVIVVIAIVLSWLGDVLLIPSGIVWFTLGGISFMASHFSFIWAYWSNISWTSIPVPVTFIVPAVYATVVCVVYSGLIGHLKKPLIAPMFLYLIANACDNTFALYQLISRPCFGTVIVYIGTVLFLVSDCALFYVRFKKHTFKRNHFIVMLTYCMAEYLIVRGMMLL